MTGLIAVRRFWWVDDPERQLLVSIGKPEETPGAARGEVLLPDIQMSGFGDNEAVQAICGVDGFQAIELALRFIGYRLTDINAKSGGRLRWQFGDDGYPTSGRSKMSVIVSSRFGL